MTLVLSGSLLAGCNDSSSGWGSSNTLTNNTYYPSYGYWHSYYGHWYPYPQNYYDPSRGYFFGGKWSSTPDSNPTPATHTTVSPSGSARAGSSASHSSGISRGGFGSSGHSSS